MTRKMESGGTEITTKKIPAIGAHVTEVVVHVNSLDKEEKEMVMRADRRRLDRNHNREDHRHQRTRDRSCGSRAQPGQGKEGRVITDQGKSCNREDPHHQHTRDRSCGSREQPGQAEEGKRKGKGEESEKER